MPARTERQTPVSPARGERGKLTREHVAAAALEFLDEHGLESLSMRRLADHVGVGTMTLYGYFADKDDLLDAIVDAAMRDRELPGPAGTWQDELRELLLASRRSLERHPALVKVRASRPVLRPEALRFAESVVGVLRRAGFEREDAAHAFRVLFNYLFGYVILSPNAAADEARRRANDALAALPADEYPAITESRDELSRAMAGDAPFEFGLDRIIEGLEARLRAER